MAFHSAHLCTLLVSSFLLVGLGIHLGVSIRLRSGGQGVYPAKESLSDTFVFPRIEWSLNYASTIKEHGIYSRLVCPHNISIGHRPGGHTVDQIGTTCEPWIARNAIPVLHELLLPGTAKALEWSSGSSTLWLLLGHVNHLISIEHENKWADDVKRQLIEIFGLDYVKGHWELHLVPPDEAIITEDTQEDPRRFARYASADFINASQSGTFDFISIDGRARSACFPRALELIKPHGGILVLDNAERSYYTSGIELVPKHWPKHVATAGHLDTTIIWVTCVWEKCPKRL